MSINANVSNSGFAKALEDPDYFKKETAKLNKAKKEYDKSVAEYVKKGSIEDLLQDALSKQAKAEQALKLAESKADKILAIAEKKLSDAGMKSADLSALEGKLAAQLESVSKREEEVARRENAIGRKEQHCCKILKEAKDEKAKYNSAVNELSVMHQRALDLLK